MVIHRCKMLSGARSPHTLAFAAKAAVLALGSP
jgi:hypothetical protein